MRRPCIGWLVLILACAIAGGCSEHTPVDWDAAFYRAEAIEYRQLDGPPRQVTARVRLTDADAIQSVRDALEQASQVHHEADVSFALAVREAVAIDRGSNGEMEFYIVNPGEWLLVRGAGRSHVQLQGDELRQVHERLQSGLVKQP